MDAQSDRGALRHREPGVLDGLWIARHAAEARMRDLHRRADEEAAAGHTSSSDSLLLRTLGALDVVNTLTGLIEIHEHRGTDGEPRTEPV